MDRKPYFWIIPISQRLYDAFDVLVKEGKSVVIGKTNLHKLRQTFASNLRAYGMDLNDIRDLLDHENEYP